MPSSPNSLVPRLRARQTRDFTGGIVQVTEDKGLGGAGLRAGRGEFAVFQIPLLCFRLNLGGLDALHAEGALLHDAHAAHGDVGIKLQLQWHIPLGVIEIEKAYVIWAGIRAKASPDAAVVDLRVESFGV